MKRNIDCVVIKPSSYKATTTSFPVVYLLHGYSGSHRDWPSKMKNLPAYADSFQLIIVCPDGGYSSWYVNSPIDSSVKMETFFSIELPREIDRRYKTRKNRKYTAITGLSMGGHGAIMLALRHSQVFGAASGISGAFDLEEIRGKYEIEKVLGNASQFSKYWKAYSVVQLAARTRVHSVALLFDCGSEDAFIASNRKLHGILRQRNIPHQFIERKGNHNWLYWTTALPDHLRFFRKTFNR